MRNGFLIGVLAAALVPGGEVRAAPAPQSASEKRLIDRSPFDRITLNEANDNAVLLVEPLDLPDRKVPERPDRRARLRVRLLDEPDKLYEVAWRDIAKVELYEEMVLAEARRLTEHGQFDEAFEYLAFLLRRYPKTDGLQAALNDYLYANAAALVAEGRWDHGLAVLEELHNRDASYVPPQGGEHPSSLLDRAADQLIKQYVERAHFATARRLLGDLERRWGADAPPAIDRWRQRLIARATERREAAEGLLEDGRLREAYDACREMLTIWPDVEGGRRLAAEIAERYPLVVVAVSGQPASPNPTALADWAARRVGRLVDRVLVEPLGPGPEGGQYSCPLGALSVREDRRQLALQLTRPIGQAPQAATLSYDVCRAVLQRADPRSPHASSTLARLVKQVRVEQGHDVVLDLRRPYMVPEALLQIPLSRIAPASLRGLWAGYEVFGRPGDRTRYIGRSEYAFREAKQPAEIVERTYVDPPAALRALRQGDVDVVDRLWPADAARLIDDPGQLRVGAYASPTVHLLAPQPGHPMLASRTFRRALVYAIDRQGILEQVLLGGRPLPGCRVLSGPFPAPTSADDVLAYAYDERIEPRPYDPELAYLLLRLARQELAAAAEKRKEEAPQLDELIIGRPAGDPIARAAVGVIARQIEAIKLPCRVKELPPGASRDPEGECHLVYIAAAMGEPLVDARRLLGRRGAAPAESPYVELALRRLDQAENWSQVRTALRRLHQIVHADLPVIALWQTVDYWAARPSVTGVGERPVTLYQNIEAWRIAPRAAAAR